MFFESNGKILLTSEYLVLDGSMSIALPSKLTQELNVEKIDSDYLHWISYDQNKNIWYEEKFIKKGETISYLGKKNNISENIKLERADIKSNMSIMLKCLNMFLFLN